MKNIIKRLRYWLFQRGKHCRSCCLWCQYYSNCRWEVLGKAKRRARKYEIASKEYYSNCMMEAYCSKYEKPLKDVTDEEDYECIWNGVDCERCSYYKNVKENVVG